MVTSNKDIGIIGGGIGGFASAIAFAKYGYRVTVFEKSAVINELGAGIQISSNGVNALSKLGVFPKYLKKVVFPNSIIFKDYKTAEHITKIQHNQNSDLPYLHLHRSDLIHALASCAEDLGVNIKLASEAKVIESKDMASKIKANNHIYDFDLIVAADGMNSRIRQYWFGEKPAYFMNQIAWRALIPSNGIKIDPSVYMGKNKHLVIYPLRDGELINIIGVQSNKNIAPQSWTNKGSTRDFFNEFSDFNTEAKHILSKIKEVKLWGLYSLSPLKSWSNRGVVLVGDAAHPMLPFMAQGSCMALEDAVVLARDFKETHDINNALIKYEKNRKRRVTSIQKTSKNNGKIFHISNNLLRKIVHFSMWSISRLFPLFLENRFRWIYKYRA